MSNGKKTLSERVTILETDYALTVESLKVDIGEIKTNTNKMAIEWPEIRRKVIDHHKVFHDHSAIIQDLKDADCPMKKVMPEDNGEKNNRWYDRKFYKVAIWSMIMTMLGLIFSNIATCGWVASNVGKLLESAP